MTNRNYSLTILGSYSGRNAGDAAILASMMGTISRQIGEDTVFEVPTTHPEFIEKHYGKKFKVRPVNVMPWTGSIRLLGIPTFRSIARTDAVLITDGIIFDVNLWNPLFNFLIILIFLVPFAKLMGKKVVCYNIGIGPLRSYWGRRFAKFVGDNSDLIMVRDEDSVKLFREIGVEKEIHLTADAVFQNWGTPEKLPSLLAEFGIDKAAAEGRLIGVNVTRYADRWLAANEKIKSKESFLERLAQVIVRLKTEKDIESAVFITQIMDVAYGRELVGHVSRIYSEKTGKSWTPALVSNERLSNHEILSLASACRVFAGMRLHSLIITAQSGTPVVGLVYAPKVKSFLYQLNTPEFAVSLATLTADSLYSDMLNALANVDKMRETQQAVVHELRIKAEESATFLRKTLGVHLILNNDEERSKVANG